VGYDQYAARAGNSHGEKALLGHGMIRVRIGHRQRISEYCRRFLEGDSVFPVIPSSLGPGPIQKSQPYLTVRQWGYRKERTLSIGEDAALKGRRYIRTR
jgi:hypothetical protein